MATTVTLLTNRTLQPGVQSFGPVTVPTGVSSIKLAVDRTNWTDPAVQINLTLDFSPDGVNWASTNPSKDTDPYPITFTASGGTLSVVIDKHSNPVPLLETSISAVFPNPASTTRQIQGSFTLSGGPLTTSVTLTVN